MSTGEGSGQPIGEQLRGGAGRQRGSGRREAEQRDPDRPAREGTPVNGPRHRRHHHPPQHAPRRRKARVVAATRCRRPSVATGGHHSSVESSTPASSKAAYHDLDWLGLKIVCSSHRLGRGCHPDCVCRLVRFRRQANSI